MVQRERATLHEAHHEGRRRNHFRQRRQIEDRALPGWCGFGFNVEPAERLAPQHAARCANLDDGSRKRALIHAALHNLGGAGEAAHGANAPLATAST